VKEAINLRPPEGATMWLGCATEFGELLSLRDNI
jgi:hypothetical protein